MEFKNTKLDNVYDYFKLIYVYFFLLERPLLMLQNKI